MAPRFVRNLLQRSAISNPAAEQGMNHERVKDGVRTLEESGAQTCFDALDFRVFIGHFMRRR